MSLVDDGQLQAWQHAVLLPPPSPPAYQYCEVLVGHNAHLQVMSHGTSVHQGVPTYLFHDWHELARYGQYTRQQAVL